MMTWIFVGMVAVSTATGLLNGRISEVSRAALEGCSAAVTLSFALLGTLCLWNGLMKVAQQAGLTEKLSRVFRPVIRVLFPDLDPSGKAAEAITLNMSANMLGLGNAATPFGLAAMKELDALNPAPATASRSMKMFVVLNTASIQLIPTTVAALRLKNGAAFPFDILPAVWITSLSSVFTGVILVKLFGRGRGKT